MNTQFVVVGPDTTVAKAVDRLLDERVSVLYVVNENHELTGIVGESDLLAAIADSQRGQDPVSLYLNRQFAMADEMAPLEVVIDQFVLHRVPSLPISSRGKLMGIIERREVLRYLNRDATAAYSTI